MGSVRIVKFANGLTWLEVDGLLLRIENDHLVVNQDGSSYILPCEVINVPQRVDTESNVIYFEKDEKND